MWRKLLRIVGFLLAVALIVAYICYSSNLARKHRAEQRVEKVVISMPDSSELEQFSSSIEFRKQLLREGIKLENSAVDSVDAVKISQHLTRNGFVSGVEVYATYSGEVHINIHQHKPVMRFMCSGYNSYVTREGEIFRSPQGGAYYAPVVTGSYIPLFAPKYEGSVAEHRTSLLDRENERLTAIAQDVAALKRDKAKCQSERSSLRKSRRKPVWESKDSHKQRLVGINLEIERCNEQLKELDRKMILLERQKTQILARKKKIGKCYDDFANLITFVSHIAEDSFWGAEIVQFVADTTSLGDISLRLVPRSGDFEVEFGTLAERDEKLEKLRSFYDDGLRQLGWNRYRKIDLRYKKQVICTE